MLIVRLIKRITCKHNLVWYRNIYGDEINAMNGKRSRWKCAKCYNYFTKSELHTDGRSK
jgi:hypothetical protein